MFTRLQSVWKSWTTRHRGTEWTPIYMLVVIVIAAIVVISLVKPAFILASQRADEANGQTLNAAKNALFILAWPLKKANQ